MDNFINKNVVFHRKRKDYTQAEVAEKMAMKCSTYSQMERNGNISGDRLLKLAEIFEIDVSLLLNKNPEISDTTEQSIFDLNPKIDNGTLKQPEPPIDVPPPFIITKKEEGYIKVLRQLKKPDFDEVIALLNAKYAKHKNRL